MEDALNEVETSDRPGEEGGIDDKYAILCIVFAGKL